MIYGISLLLLLSAGMNFLLSWYIREYIKRVREVRNSTLDFKNAIDNYKEALERLGRMEIYHGEPVIQAIMENTYFVIGEQEKLSSSLSQILGEETNG